MSALRDSKKELSLKTDSKSEYDRLRNEVRDIDAKLDEKYRDLSALCRRMRG